MRLQWLLALAFIVLLSACHPWQKTHRLPVQLRFDGQPLRCEQLLEIGGKEWRVRHAQLYLTDFRDASGQPLPLKPGLWQSDKTVLLTLEKLGCMLDKQIPVNREIVFDESVNWRQLKQLTFRLGVMPEENNTHPRLQPSPLNVAGMIYSEQGGHRFARFDLLAVSDHWSYILGCPMGTMQEGTCPQDGPIEYQIDVEQQDEALIFHLDRLVKGLHTSRRHSCTRDVASVLTCEQGRNNLRGPILTLEAQ